MQGAIALLCPSHYLEPFGGVAVEAMLCGTPVISSDWGGFAEFNVHGRTGYRCRTMDHFVWAAKNIISLDREAIRLYAQCNFSLEFVALMYEEYFGQIKHLYDSHQGFYFVNPERDQLDWLERIRIPE